MPVTGSSITELVQQNGLLGHPRSPPSGELLSSLDYLNESSTHYLQSQAIAKHKK